MHSYQQCMGSCGSFICATGAIVRFTRFVILLVSEYISVVEWREITLDPRVGY